MSRIMKKLIFSAVILFSLLSYQGVPAEAAGGSSGEVSFYGTYEYPTDEPDPTPNPIPNPAPIQVLPDAAGKAPIVVNKLPQTGESNNLQASSLGFGLFIISISIYLKNKHKQGSFHNEIN